MAQHTATGMKSIQQKYVWHPHMQHSIRGAVLLGVGVNDGKITFPQRLQKTVYGMENGTP